MNNHKSINAPYAPENFIIPEGTNHVAALQFTLDRAEGVLALLSDSVYPTDKAAWNAISAVEGMMRQCRALVNAWNDWEG